MAPSRYSMVAIVLHWAIAVMILGQIFGGWWMGDAIKVPATQELAYQAFQLHKSFGLTVLALSLVRLGWRLANPPPAPPPGMEPWQRIASGAVHAGFYGVMILAPFTGWLYASTGWSDAFQRFLDVPTVWFGVIEIPSVPGVAGLGEADRKAVGEAAYAVHEKMAWVALGLLALHVGAALKHHFIDRDDVLARMIPGLRSRTGPGVQA